MSALLVIGAFVIGWEVYWWGRGVRPIGPSRLRRMLQESEGNKPLLVDVRTATEFKLFHIEGAQSQPDLLLDRNSFDLPDKERPLVVICLSGHRSPVAGAKLKKQGFRKVYYLSWGMIAWLLSGGRVKR